MFFHLIPGLNFKMIQKFKTLVPITHSWHQPEEQKLTRYASSKVWLQIFSFFFKGICTLDLGFKKKKLHLTIFSATNENQPLRISSFPFSCIKHTHSSRCKMEVHFPTFQAILQNSKAKSEGNQAGKKRNPWKGSLFPSKLRTTFLSAKQLGESA